MLGLFLGLETATRGLLAQQASIETVAHNIDNANTPGFSRQRVELAPSMALNLGVSSSGTSGQLGTGVQIEQITRLRDQFLDTQYRSQNQSLGQWSVQQDTLSKVTAIINEPSSTGISAALQDFWNAWGKLSPDSEDLSARMQVQQAAVTLTQTINQTAGELSNLTSDLQTTVQSTVAQVNSYLKQIATVNQQILAAQGVGQQPNDLLDQRDYMIDQLSKMTDVNVTDSGSNYQIAIGGTTVLQNSTVMKQLSALSPAQNPSDEVSWTAVTGGQLKGLQNALNTVQNYHNDLNSLANTLANGQMNISLAGGWTIPGPSDGGDVVFPVSGTFSDGKPFTAGSKVKDYPGENIQFTTVTGTNTPLDGTVVATVPQGATVTVAGLNGLHSLGFTQDGQAGDFFVPSSGERLSLTSSSTGVNSSVTIDPATPSNVLSFLGLSSGSTTGASAVPTSAQMSGMTQVANTTSSVKGPLAFEVNGQSYSVQVNSGDSISTILSNINAAVGAPVATINSSGTFQLTSPTTGTSSEVSIDDTSSDDILGYLGLSAGMSNGTPGAASPASVSSMQTLGTVSAAQADAGTLKFSIDGQSYAVTVRPGDSVKNVVSAINAQVGSNVASLSGAPITADNITVGPNAEGVGAALRTLDNSLQGISGSGTLAMTIDSMKSATLTFPDPANPGRTMNGTVDSFIQSIAGALGVQGQEANNQVTNQTSLLQQVDNQRQSVSGVSIDEEMSNMIQYQQSYNASAKLISTINDMLNTLMTNV